MKKIFTTMFALLALLYSCESGGDNGGSNSSEGAVKISVSSTEDISGLSFAMTAIASGFQEEIFFDEGESSLSLDLDPGVYQVHVYAVNTGYTMNYDVTNRKMLASLEKNDEGVYQAATSPLLYALTYLTVKEGESVNANASLSTLSAYVGVTMNLSEGSASDVAAANGNITRVATEYNCTDEEDISTEYGFDVEFTYASESSFSSVFYVMGLELVFDVDSNYEEPEFSFWFNSDKTLNGDGTLYDGEDSSTAAEFSFVNNFATGAYLFPYINDVVAPVIIYSQGGEITDNRVEGDTDSATIE